MTTECQYQLNQGGTEVQRAKCVWTVGTTYSLVSKTERKQAAGLVLGAFNIYVDGIRRLENNKDGHESLRSMYRSLSALLVCTNFQVKAG